MANATAKVNKAATRRTDEFRKRSSATLSAETTFYTGAMVGITTGGYLAKFDDTQSLLFAGLVRGREGNPVLPAGTAADGTIDLDYHMPFAFELAISGVAVTSIGKKVYATYDATGTLDSSATTYANLVGTVVDYLASGIALVEPAYDGLAAHARLTAAKWLAATGTQTLTKWDINKTIFCPNTAAHTVNLPAVAGTQAGDRLTFVKTTSDAQAVTLDGDSAETIDGSATLATVDAQYDCVTLVSTGAAWVVLNRDIA